MNQESLHEPEEMNEIKKSCSNCKTSETPLWRKGPSGPKSLGNACGIRYKKKKREFAALNEGVEKKKEKSSTASLTSTTAAAAETTSTTPSMAAAKSRSEGGGGGSSGKWGNLRVRLVFMGKEVVILQKPRTPTRKRQRSGEMKLGEEEEEEEAAAVVLMSLSSCGFDAAEFTREQLAYYSKRRYPNNRVALEQYQEQDR